MDELERLGINDELGAVYDNELMQKRLMNTARNWGYDDGKADGKAEGLEEGKKIIAKNLLKDGISIEVVSRNTGLSIEELNKLNN